MITSQEAKIDSEKYSPTLLNRETHNMSQIDFSNFNISWENSEIADIDEIRLSWTSSNNWIVYEKDIDAGTTSVTLDLSQMEQPTENFGILEFDVNEDFIGLDLEAGWTVNF